MKWVLVWVALHNGQPFYMQGTTSFETKAQCEAFLTQQRAKYSELANIESEEVRQLEAVNGYTHTHFGCERIGGM